MATTVVDTIGSGGDYADISSWIAGTATDLVAADEVREGRIIDASAFDETSTIDITGATTDATRYRHLTAAADVRHNGTGDGSGARYPYSGGGHAFTVNEDYFRTSWLDFSYPSGGGDSDEIFRINATGFVAEYCLFHDIPHLDGDALYTSTGSLTLYTSNCLFWTLARAGIHIQNATGVTWYSYNNTLWDCRNNASGYGCIGFSDLTGDSTIHAKNTVADEANGSSHFFIYNSGANGSWGNSTNNASGDSTAPGPNAITGITDSTEFESLSGTIDLHLASGSQLRDAGVDLSADGSYAITGDIDGDSRSSWDIGGDEISSGADTVTLPHIGSTAQMHAPTITSTAATVDLPHIGSTSQMHAPSITEGGTSANVFVEDTFTDSDGTQLANHTPETGGSWVKHPATNSGTVIAEILSDTAVGDETGTNGWKYYNDATPPSEEMEVTITFEADDPWDETATDQGFVGVWGHGDTTDRTYYIAQRVFDGNIFRIRSYVAGSSNTLASVSVAQATAGDIWRITLTIEKDGSGGYDLTGELDLGDTGTVDHTLTANHDGSNIPHPGTVGFEGTGQDTYHDDFKATDLGSSSVDVQLGHIGSTAQMHAPTITSTASTVNLPHIGSTAQFYGMGINVDKTAEVFSMVEFSATNTSPSQANAYDVVAEVTFTHDVSGRAHTTEMFYAGAGDTWKFRFTGDEAGTWTYTTTADGSGSTTNDPQLDGLSGTVEVTANANALGFLSNDGKHWAWMRGDYNSLEGTVPQLVMHGGNSGAPLIDNTTDADTLISEFMDTHGFNGFQLYSLAGLWFDKNGTRDVPTGDADPDPLTFDALELFIQRVHENGGNIHMWAWEDESRSGAASQLDGGIGGYVEDRLNRYIAARLGPVPGWTIGYGFDLDEWTTETQMHSWNTYMQDRLGWRHLTGARPVGPNSGTDHSSFNSWNSGLEYSSYEHHEPTYDVYVAAQDEVAGQPTMSEDRFRVRGGGSGKDYTEEQTRKGLYISTMAGGISNIWGQLDTTDEVLSTGKYSNAAQLNTYQNFFFGQDRFEAGLVRDNALTNSDGYCLRRSDNTLHFYYREGAASIDIDLSAGSGTYSVTAVDTAAAYSEVDKGTVSAGTHTISLPSSSDWVLAVEATGGDTISLGHIAGTANFYPPSLTLSNQTITLGHIGSTVQFFAPSLQASAQTITLPYIGSTAQLHGFSITEGAGTIEGTVTLNGNPVAGVRVYAVDTSNHTVAATTTTDSNGDYSFSGLATGTYDVFYRYIDGSDDYVQGVLEEDVA